MSSLKNHLLAVALLATLFLQTASASGQQKSESKAANSEPKQVAMKIEATYNDSKKAALHYWQYLPASHSTEGDATPLMIFLHGRGECGTDLELVKRWGPPRLIENGKQFPFIVLSPQCVVPGWDSTALKDLLDHAIKNLNVDRSRIYITGLSMGGYGTWSFVAENNHLIAAAVPICGGGHPRLADRLTRTPIWAFHGDADRVVPVSQTTNLVSAIEEAGGKNVKLKVYKGVNHNSWVATYENPAVYEWLLSHKLDDK